MYTNNATITGNFLENYVLQIIKTVLPALDKIDRKYLVFIGF